MKPFILYTLILCLIAGCSPDERDTGGLVLSLETSPNKLDPAYVVDVSEGRICSLLYQGLVRFTPAGEVVPDLARGWEIDDSGMRYRFHLDTRMKFSTGRPVVAADVIRSFERVLSPATASPRRWVLQQILGADDFTAGRSPSLEGLDAPDDSTLVITLKEPYQPFIMLLGMPGACVVPPGTAEPLSDHPVGSGPWMLVDWKRADRMVLQPNRYHPRPSASIESIIFRIIPEPFTRIAEFESGSLDILHVPSAELDRFLGDERLRDRLQIVTELRVTYVGLNNRHPVLGDLRVRRALNMAIDVERLITVLLQGQAVRAAGAIPPALPGYRTRAPYRYDPATARRLLREAGVPDGYELDLWQRDSPEGNLMCEALQGYLQQVGIEARLVKREWSAFKQAVGEGKVDAFFLDWYADYPDAENFLFPLFHSGNSGGGGNRVFFSNHRVDSLITLSQRTIDAEARTALYARIDSLVFDQAPWIFLYFPRSVYAVNPRIRGYEAARIYLGEEYRTVRTVDTQTE